jgi:hypothetical protein
VAAAAAQSTSAERPDNLAEVEGNNGVADDTRPPKRRKAGQGTVQPETRRSGRTTRPTERAKEVQ